jgi:hypothetical protein
MWKMLKWSVIGGVVLLILSDIEISTSLQVRRQPRGDQLPALAGDQPWGTLRWHAGRFEHHWYGLAGKPKRNRTLSRSTTDGRLHQQKRPANAGLFIWSDLLSGRFGSQLRHCHAP